MASNLPGTPKAPSGNRSFGTATPGASPQADAKSAFQGKQANLMAKGAPKSEKVAKISAMKRRLGSS